MRRPRAARRLARTLSPSTIPRLCTLPLPLLLALAAGLLPRAARAVHVDYEDCADLDPQPGTARFAAMADCFPRLCTHPADFAVLSHVPAWAFIQEVPYIRLPPAYADPAQHARLMRPFRCADHAQSALSGASFDIHARLPNSSHHLCVWAGPHCRFNALLDKARLLAARDGLQLGVTGFLLDTARRRCLGHYTAPLDDDVVVVVGRHAADAHRSQLDRDFESLFGPFLWTTWLLIVAGFFLYLLVSLLIFRRSSGRRWRDHRFWMGFLFFSFAANGGNSASHPPHGLPLAARPEPQFHNRNRRPVPLIHQKTASMLIATAFVLSIAFLVLIYEQGVTRFLFQDRSKSLPKKVRALSPTEAATYAMLNNSAVEAMFNRTANPSGDMFDGDNVPWQQCRDDRECIDWVRHGTNGVQFAVMFSRMADYYLKDEPYCRELVKFETTELYQFSGAIWQTDAVPEIQRRLFNIDLVTLRQTGKIGELLKSTPHPSCPTDSSARISPFMLLLPKLFFVLPLLLAALLFGCCNPKTKEQNL